MIATHPSATERLQEMRVRIYRGFAPPPDILVSEWARRNRTLAKGTSARPGPFRPEKFQIEMMDVITDPNVHEIVVMKCTQMGYSDAVLNNIIGYYIDLDPKPIMLVQPTIDNAKDYGKKRITPMIESTPALKAKIRASTSRRPGNTIALKEFPGGFLKLAGANSGTGIRSDPIPVLLLDETEAYPLDVDGEGDPVEIAKRRTDQFSDYKIFEGSTPAKPKGLSRIDKRFLESDQRHFHVPCPVCEKMQPLFWRDPETQAYRLVYQLDAGGEVLPASVGYKCAHCGEIISERYKQQMLDAGKWVAKFPGRSVVGFHINALYSPWRELWADLAKEWVAAQRDPERLKAFINLRLGETWEEQGLSLEPHKLRRRCEKYSAEVPKGVGLLTAAVDVQDDRLEVVVKGWGAGEESWLIAWEQFFGDPGVEELWFKADEFLRKQFEHESGQKLPIAAAMVDSGGHHTDSVYRFVKARQGRRVFALKGSSEAGKEILSKFSFNNRYRVKLYTVGVDTAKDRIFSRMQIETSGLGYMHLPDWVEDEYLDQLTSEKRVRRYNRRARSTVREYVKTRARNEALDLEVYALAALYVLGPGTLKRLKELAEDANEKPEPASTEQTLAPKQSRGRGERSGWVDGWKEG